MHIGGTIQSSRCRDGIHILQIRYIVEGISAYSRRSTFEEESTVSLAALEVVDASAEEMVVVFAELGVDTSLVDDTSLVELLFHMSCMEEQFDRNTNGLYIRND